MADFRGGIFGENRDVRGKWKMVWEEKGVLEREQDNKLNWKILSKIFFYP